MTDLLVLVVTAALAIVPLVLCLWKGKPFFGVLGFFFAILGLVGAIRLAKPNSRYARRFYSHWKMSEAKRRFPREAQDVPDDWIPRRAARA